MYHHRLSIITFSKGEYKSCQTEIYLLWEEEGPMFFVVFLLRERIQLCMNLHTNIFIYIFPRRGIRFAVKFSKFKRDMYVCTYIGVRLGYKIA